eukprot:c17284_g1_i1 orf=191-2026(-)
MMKRKREREEQPSALLSTKLKKKKEEKEEERSEAEHGELFGSCRFQDLGLCETLSNHLHERMGFSAPTHIQQAAIPIILSERDALVNAETGTGKTVVYLAPIVHKLQANMKKISRSDGMYALVLVPTRELCLQVYEVVKQLVHRFQWLVPGHVMGGENRLKEKARLRKGVTILVATPGRLLDHLQNTASFHYENLRWIVFDEADRLLDLGFGKDIKSILEFLGSQPSASIKQHAKNKKGIRQHLLLSATLGDEVMKLASLSLRNPAMVGLTEPSQLQANVSRKSENLSAQAGNFEDNKAAHGPLEYSMPIQLVQRYVTVPCNLRLVTLLVVLHMWLDTVDGHKAVVFLSTCDSVDFHFALLNDFCWSFFPREQQNQAKGIIDCKMFRLHGNMSQQERTETFFEFNKQDSALLLCTDVAARGLDIPRVTHILQYDPSGDAHAYVHRVGRTARLGQKGEALLFLQPCERDYLIELQKHGVTLQEVSFTGVWAKIFQKIKANSVRDTESLETHPTVLVFQKSLETFISRQASMREVAADAFRSYIRAYTAHKGDLKAIFQVKKLHLGHVAKSFGLCDRPSMLGKSLSKKRNREKKASNMRRMKKKRNKPARMLE